MHLDTHPQPLPSHPSPLHVPLATKGAALHGHHVCPEHRVHDSTLAVARLSCGSSLSGGSGEVAVVLDAGGAVGSARNGAVLAEGASPTSPGGPGSGHMPPRSGAHMAPVPQSLLPARAGTELCFGPVCRAVRRWQCRALMFSSPHPAPRSSAMAKPMGSRHGPCCSQPASARSGS